MKVVSLFDGISCGFLALERAEIPVEKYIAYEIDKSALQISRAHFSDKIEYRGNVETADFTEFRGYDLLIGGSPCQGFSFAGKQLNFEDERSKLFFEYVRALKEIQPKYFLLENVQMKQEYKDIISDYLGVEPVMIDSALVSAQQRKRLYWTNIPNITQPADKHIYLQDVVESDALVDRDKAHAIIASIGRTTHREYFQRHQGQLVYSIMLSNINGGFGETKPRVHIDRSFTLTTKNLPHLIIGNKVININVDNYKLYIRKVTPLECERLQTLPDNYTDVGLSNTQRYKCLGNAWTVDVIAHILGHIQ